MSIRETLGDISDLFGWSNKITDVRSSSKEAYIQIKEEGHLSRQENTIVDSLKPNFDYSLQEIAKKTGISINAVSGRVNGLKKKNILYTL